MKTVTIKVPTQTIQERVINLPAFFCQTNFLTGSKDAVAILEDGASVKLFIAKSGYATVSVDGKDPNWPGFNVFSWPRITKAKFGDLLVEAYAKQQKMIGNEFEHAWDPALVPQL